MVETLETGNRPTLAFWLLATVIVAYVVACTGFRENHWEADAWEHQRAIVALSHDLWHPGNPTYDSPEPSIRYSPYMLAGAIVVRWTGADAYSVLSGAAVLNTVLLILAVLAILRQFGEGRAAAAVLLVMVALWGGPPGYAGSYALADLPWHQVNPSAFSFALSLFAWAIWLAVCQRRVSWVVALLIVPLLVVSTLDHGMTGAFAVVVLGMTALMQPRGQRLKAIVILGGLLLATAGLCLLWPWYSFRQAVLSGSDPYWYNRANLVAMFTRWCAPALLMSLYALLAPERRAVRLPLAAAFVCYGLGLAAFPLHSATLARMPMPSMILLHIPIGVAAYHLGAFRPSVWRRSLVDWNSSEGRRAVVSLQGILVIVLLFHLTQMSLVVAELPYLARPYLAAALHKDSRTLHLRRNYAEVLKPVGTNDVVLSDLVTAWPVPSFRGRVVAALHYEYFVPGQERRVDDVESFFGGATPEQRRAILERYHVRWILLNSVGLGPEMFQSLLDQRAIVSQAGDFVLLDARTWREDRT